MKHCTKLYILAHSRKARVLSSSAPCRYLRLKFLAGVNQAILVDMVNRLIYECLWMTISNFFG